LLQITVSDRIIVFDISYENPQEIFFFNATKQFIEPSRYVDSGIKISEGIEDPSPEKDGYFFTEVSSNRSSDMYYTTQERKVFKRDFKWDKIPRSPVCLGIFKKYAEVDLQELCRIQTKTAGQSKLDNIDLQTTLCTFNQHTIFSLFAHSVKLHE